MKKYFILAATAAMFAACSNTDEITQTEIPSERIPLTIGASFSTAAPNATMRGNNTALQSDTLSKDVKIGLYLFKQGNKTTTSSELYEKSNEEMKWSAVNSTKIDITPNSTGTTLVYPDKKDQGIDLYAYAPYASTGAPTDLSSGKLSIQTKDNQTLNTNYYASDILWGSQGGGIENSNTVLSSQPSQYILSAEKYKDDLTTAQDGYDGTSGKIFLPLYHVGSKIIINLIPDGMDIAKLRGAKVKIYVENDKGELNITTGKIDNLSKSSGTDPIAITLTDKLGKQDDGTTDITTYTADKGGYSTDNSNLHGYSCAAVILPQKVNSASSTYKLIEIELDANTKYAYTISTEQAFDPLKVYTYNIKVKASALTVTTTIENWSEAFSGVQGDGDAVLQ